MKEIVDELDFNEIKNFCSRKDNVKSLRRQATAWEKILAKDASDKELLSKIRDELLKLNHNNTSNLIKEWAKI